MRWDQPRPNGWQVLAWVVMAAVFVGLAFGAVL